MKVDESFCMQFNTLRANNQGNSFTRKEILSLLVDNIRGFSKQDYIISVLCKKGVLIKSGKRNTTRYSFTDKPVHIRTLIDSIGYMNNYNKEQFQKFFNKNVEPGLTHVSEEYCINFLKERGYKILKQVVDYKEV